MCCRPPTEPSQTSPEGEVLLFYSSTVPEHVPRGGGTPTHVLQTNRVCLRIQPALTPPGLGQASFHHLEGPLASPFLVPLKALPSSELRGCSRGCPTSLGQKLSKQRDLASFSTATPGSGTCLALSSHSVNSGCCLPGLRMVRPFWNATWHCLPKPQ